MEKKSRTPFLDGIRKAFKTNNFLKKMTKLNLDSKSKELNRTSQIAFVSALMTAAISINPVMDRFISWILVVAGAAFILAFSNLSSTVEILPKWTLISGMIGLAITGIIGFIAKYTAMSLHSTLAASEVFQDNFLLFATQHEKSKLELLEEANKHGVELEDKPDPEVFSEALKEVFGEIEGTKIMKSLSDCYANPLKGMKESIDKLNKQRNYSVLTVVSFIITAVVLFIGIAISLI